MSRGLSFHAAILAILVTVAVLPLALIGLWLTGSAARSGEALLEARLGRVLEESVFAIEGVWVRYRSELLDFAEATPVDRERASRQLSPVIQAVSIRAADGSETFRLTRAEGAELFGASFVTELALYDVGTDAGTGTGTEIGTGSGHGTLEAMLSIQALRVAAGESTVGGAVLTVIDRRTGAVLLPIPFDIALLEQPRFQWRGEEWLVRRRATREPPLDIAVAAPVTPFVVPFRRAARRGSLVLLLVASLGTVAAALLTQRQTRSLTRLAAAADAVAAGDLQRTVDTTGNLEVASVARAFNAMTESLRRTLAQLAERESLAAVNEFAAALAHEVRNPLSAIQLDLQEVEERLAPDSELRALQTRALADVQRLERTVAGALATARSGRIDPRPLDLREPLRLAVHAAQPRFAARHAQLDAAQLDAAHLDTAVFVSGDTDALQRAFLNLLLNAADALAPGGRAQIECDVSGAQVYVRIRDDGEGIPAGRLPHVFDAFHTTRPGGTGVGLAVARRIVVAHGGDIRITSEPGEGTTVEVRLPRGV
ncbi:hypothetical protein BH23GEM9_BH23GEM9_03470 [soil metagenome]